MKISPVLAVCAVMAVQPARAIYAPVPEQEQGKDFSVTVRAGASYDSNLFGAATNEVDSAVYTLAPRLIYNRSLTDQTFLSTSYGLTLDYVPDRGGNELLDSHELNIRVAHAFSKETTIDVNNLFTVTKNPDALLPGVGNRTTDQSSNRNQLDGRFTTPLSAKAGISAKARSISHNFHSGALGRDLDRIENLYGLAGEYAALPEVKLVSEYRHQDVFYRTEGELKNKRSDYLMGGVDYGLAQKLTITGRAGAEWRRRASASDTTAPYVELTGKYDYAEKSFLLGGYAYTFDETSDPLRFTDTKVHRFFASVQHSITALIVLSASGTYEPSQLQGRPAALQPDVDEDTIRAGVALSYLPTKNWMISANYDYDKVWSGDPSRDMLRRRFGVAAVYSF